MGSQRRHGRVSGHACRGMSPRPDRSLGHLETIHHDKAAVDNWLLEELRRQLSTPGNDGYVWVSNWNKYFYCHFGSLRNFLAGHPDLFSILPGPAGKGFRVSLRKRSPGEIPTVVAQ